MTHFSSPSKALSSSSSVALRQSSCAATFRPILWRKSRMTVTNSSGSSPGAARKQQGRSSGQGSVREQPWSSKHANTSAINQAIRAEAVLNALGSRATAELRGDHEACVAGESEKNATRHLKESVALNSRLSLYSAMNALISATMPANGGSGSVS